MNTGPLEAKFGRTALAELQALEKESDPLLYRQGLLQLASRLEQSDRFDAAAELYSTLSSSQVSDEFTARAQRRLQTLQGQGGFGSRFEVLLHNFCKEAASSSAILAMGAGSLAFRLTRAATLSRLASSSSVGFFTQGFGMRAAATLAGFAAETTAFTLAGKSGASLLGQPTDWSVPALGKEWASGALLLGSLKVAGAVTEAAMMRGLSKQSGGLGWAQRLAPNAALYGGILAGEGLQAAFGLKASALGNPFADAFATLLQFHVGGRLAGEIFGARLQRLERALDLHAKAITEYPASPWRPDLVFASVAGSRPLGLGENVDSLQSRPLFMVGTGEGGNSDAKNFGLIRQIGTKTSYGHLLLDLGTREDSASKEMLRTMVSLEDAFWNLMLNYQSNMLKGPLAELLRKDSTLRRSVWSHANEKGKKLWAFIDADTGELQRLASLNADRSPRTLLYWEPGRNEQGERPRASTALSLAFDSNPSGFPVAVAEAFRWDSEAEILYQENKVSAGQGLRMTLFPGRAEELRFDLATETLQWGLRDAQDRTLLAMHLKRLDGQSFFEFSKEAPALPKGFVKPRKESPAVSTKSEPDSRKAKRKPASPKPKPEPALPLPEPSLPVSAPEPSPAVESPEAGLEPARLALDGVVDPLTEGHVDAFKKLKRELKKLNATQLEAFEPELGKRLGVFFRLEEAGIRFLQSQIPLFPSEARQRLLYTLLDFLADPIPPRRVATWDVFRQVLTRLSYVELESLSKTLEKKFPPNSLGPDRGMMVQQVRILIRELLGDGSGGGLPPSGAMALLVGAGTLLYGHEASAATIDAFSNGFHGVGGEPLLGASLLAGAATIALRSKWAQRLGAEALSLGSALLARFTRGETPLVLERDKSHPYQLILPDLRRNLVPEKEFVIAKREGRSIHLKIGAVTDQLAPFEHYPEGTLRVSFNLYEGDRRGGGFLFLSPDAVNLYNIQTINMKSGIGTIFLDWLATQASLMGREFSIRDIWNPQIFRIVRREGLMETPDIRVSGKYHVPLTGRVEYEGHLLDPFLDEEQEGAAFNFSGKPNPELLPFYLRP